MTVIAVVCIYAVQLRKQVRGIALFRSIGITKRQLRLLLTFETLILCLPALGAGTLLGTIITKLILKLFVYAKSAPVQVDVPLSQLAVTVLDCRDICGANDCFPHRTFRAADGQDAYSPPTCACV